VSGLLKEAAFSVAAGRSDRKWRMGHVIDGGTSSYEGTVLQDDIDGDDQAAKTSEEDEEEGVWSRLVCSMLFVSVVFRRRRGDCREANRQSELDRRRCINECLPHKVTFA
jgi:hypothetical protein